MSAGHEKLGVDPNLREELPEHALHEPQETRLENSSDQDLDLSEREVRDIEKRSRPNALLIYEIIRKEGEEELLRPLRSLWWSGLAAGLSISFSVIFSGLLHSQIADIPGKWLLVALGYPFGFMVVILARQQLFTENTITVVLPLMVSFTWGNLLRLLRLWSIVLGANLIGTFIVATALLKFSILEPTHIDGVIDISRLALHTQGWAAFFRGIPSGFLIASLVWLMPSARPNAVPAIVTVTYVIGACHFPHVVAGSTEAFVLLVAGHINMATAYGNYLLPVLAGNVVGGTALFAILAYAQVSVERADKVKSRTFFARFLSWRT